MSDKEIRKYLMFSKKNRIPKNEAVQRVTKIHQLSVEDYKRALLVATEVYG